MTLRTVSQLSSSAPPDPRIGQRLWKPTSQVLLPAPLAQLSGKLLQHEIHYARDGKCIVRPYKVPRDPRTPYQLPKRVYMGQAQRNWSRLPEAVRRAWQSFALAHIVTGDKQTGRALSLAGFNAYVQAQIFRQGMGGELSVEAPAPPVPKAPLSIEEIPPPDGESFAFRLHHDLADIPGCSVLLQLTPAMPTLRRTPKAKDLRWAGVSDPESFLPLGPDGAIYVLPRARFSIDPGRRYAVRARILSPDGIPGAGLMVDLIRPTSDPAGWVTQEVPPAPEEGGPQTGSAGEVDLLPGADVHHPHGSPRAPVCHSIPMDLPRSGADQHGVCLLLERRTHLLRCDRLRTSHHPPEAPRTPSFVPD